ncbi:hypothetical protein RRG08_023277 [Elysia crispata]|uniref:C-type lectin domain-containing protein n=1 Tax=Elysia crispata TaxID=231223 RepID=A0AAE0YX06_9GAST|nr:hypothetical protein RRG08_023277 [Elysia crispata]
MASKFVLLVLAKTIASSNGGQTNPCYIWPESSYAGQDLCIRVFTDQQWSTFSEAQAFCEAQHDAGLAEVRTAQHWEEVLVAMVTKNITHPVWLGARRTTQATTLQWLSDHQTINVPSQWWGSNTTDSSASTSDTCLALGLSHTLEALPCSQRLQGLVCQRRADNPCRHFLPGAEYFRGHCFLPLKVKLTACEARKRCDARGAKVVEPGARELRQFVKSFADIHFGNQDGIFIGCFRASGSEDFRWASSGKSPNETDWGREEPNTGYGGDVTVQMIGADNWRWAVAPEATTAYTICQKDISEECDDTLVAGSCFTLHTSPLAWPDAKAMCEKDGLYLIEPKTDKLRMALVRLLMDDEEVFHASKRERLSFFSLT